jgi:Tol biopolymer transport system component
MWARTPAAGAAAILLVAGLSTPSLAASHDPAPGRGRIVFGAETLDGTQLWTIWPNGTHLRQVTHVDGDAINPDWSPDGRSITFEWDTPDTVQVAVMNADGSGLRALPHTGCEFEGQPAFSADQKRIIYERYDCNVDDSLFSQPVDGGEEQRLTDAFPDGHTDPNVSPDGTHLSYIRLDGGVEFEQALTVADADGSNPRDLLPPSWDIAIKHAWSADNQHLVFTRDANPDPGTGILNANVGTVSLDGDVTMLTHFSGGRFSAFAGSYSPDGRWIVYRLQDNDAGSSSLHVMRTDGSHDHQIFAEDGLRARFIDWG